MPWSYLVLGATPMQLEQAAGVSEVRASQTKNWGWGRAASKCRAAWRTAACGAARTGMSDGASWERSAVRSDPAANAAWNTLQWSAGAKQRT